MRLGRLAQLAVPAALFGVAVLVACDDVANPNGARPIVDFNGVPYGDVCASDADCGGLKDSCCTGGKCSKDGWCSPKCKSDQDCPEGYFCIDHDGTRCFAGCADDRDCPIGWICEAKSGHNTCRFK
ncbi:MAG: hypothetical protein U0414_33845 [Polyangiaceae bacterium]